LIAAMARSGPIFRRVDEIGKAAFGRHWERIAELWRYGHVGLLNTAFGYGLYAGLVWLGLNLYVAQVLAQIVSVCFNYFTLRRLVFLGARSRLRSFIGAYAFNYLMAVTFLAIAHHFIPSPYLAGFVAIIAVAGINYLVLKRFVFRAPPA
jgi:putative flippase GtrA